VYFPYLRGKQYELLALKEMAPVLGGGAGIVPVIEPVKEPDGGLERCLDALWNNRVAPIIVVNPAVGDLKSEIVSTDVANFVGSRPLVPNLSLGLIISESTDVRRLLAEYRQHYSNTYDLALIHDGVAGDLATLRDESAQLGRKYDLVSDELRQRHFRSFITDSIGVVMHDGFSAEERNSDYLPRVETDFAEDFLYYRDEGWRGFGDYLTLGRGWSEGGFTPRAVAIHWTYEPAVGSPIKIRHFTSESNGDLSNVGGKFLEAAGKLARFLDSNGIHTAAAEVMRQHVRNQTYPGLGIVKKLSIQNHLELMATILGRP